MKFPVTLTPEGSGFVVTFPDIPEAITQGETREEALQMAQEALEAALEFYFEDRRPVPIPYECTQEEDAITLPASLVAKILLLNEMLAQNIRPAELARRLGTSPQTVNRLINLQHTSRIDGIDAALHVLGKSLEIRLV